MAETEKDKSYDLEPVPDEQEPPGQPAAPQGPPEAPAARSVRDLDVCPNCGSPLGGVDSVVCLRCGFDLKSLKVIRTEKGQEVIEEPQEQPQKPPALSGPGAGDLWAPAALAGVGLGLLALGCLAGSEGLLGGAGGEPPGATARLEGLLKVFLRASVLAAAGLGSLWGLAVVTRARVGDVRLAAVRMLGIAAAVGLLAFFNVENEGLEWTVESVAQALAFVGLSMALFGLSLRDAATLLGITVVCIVGLLLVSALALWAMAPA